MSAYRLVSKLENVYQGVYRVTLTSALSANFEGTVARRAFWRDAASVSEKEEDNGQEDRTGRSVKRNTVSEPGFTASSQSGNHHSSPPGLR